jgi:N-acyl-D-aspartate/D-glutamate deacylase
LVDVLIKDGFVVNGTGNPWFKADVAIEDGKIIKIGRLSLENAEYEIDAEGFVVCPGFIDIHTHGGLNLLINPRAESMIRQGITTIVAGNCGSSVSPVDQRVRKRASNLGVSPDWTSFEDYYNTLEKRGISINLASFVGHGNIRAIAMGLEDREPSSLEMEKMKALVAEAMKDSAYGLSTGLIYPPSCYAKTAEIVELCKVVAKYGGIYATHFRGKGETIFDAVKEGIEIGKRAGVPAQLSHISPSPPVYRRVPEAFNLIEEARSKGLDVATDTTIYLRGGWGMTSLLPDWASDGGPEKMFKMLKDSETREKIKIDTNEFGSKTGGSGKRDLLKMGRWDKVWVSLPEKLAGKSIAEIARIRGMEDPYDALFDLIIEEGENLHGMAEDKSQVDTDYSMSHPLCAPITDGSPLSPYGVLGEGKQLPRNYGTFALVFGWYVRDRGILKLEEAVRKSTSFPAQRIKIKHRGLLMEGMFADITIFDPKNIRDKATYENPHQYPEGIKHVIVNGQIVIDEGEHTDVMPGKTLRHEALTPLQV